MAIVYGEEGTVFRYPQKRRTNRWIRETIEEEGQLPGQISVVFCSDAYLLEMNRTYLQHDYFTDIITFDYCEAERSGRRVSGDLFISVDTVRANARELGTAFEDELHRVIIHGVLHLLGYEDKSIDNQRIMRSKEDYYLMRWASMES